MQTKTAKVRELLRGGDEMGALRIAKSFRILGEHKVAVQRGWDAAQNPRFARQIGRDPDALVADAITALKTLYPVD